MFRCCNAIVNFDTDEEVLKNVFSKAQDFRTARIVMRKHERWGQMVSSGYGFVEFTTVTGAMEALKKFQGVMVDGHELTLRVSRSRPGASETLNVPKRRRRDELKESGLLKSKIIVKNLPFQANKKELQALFGTFGMLKTIRIPKKFGGAHRGFAFIEFVSEQEAQNAFDALQNSHFYGRHLVLQYAKQVRIY